MKKIKYIILSMLLILTFIPNVKAEECHNYIDFNNLVSSPNNYTINSSDSITLTYNPGASSGWYQVIFTSNLIGGDYYVLSFDYETDVTPSSPFKAEVSIGGAAGTGNYTTISNYNMNSYPKYNDVFNSNSYIGYKFVNSNFDATDLLLNITDRKGTNSITLKNVRFLLLREYDYCLKLESGEIGSGGGENMTVDFSILIPYLLLIAALILLIIFRYFIKDLFKSRR